MTLTEIRFIGLNNGGINAAPFLQSLSLQPVPEPATGAVLALGALALLRRRR